MVSSPAVLLAALIASRRLTSEPSVLMVAVVGLCSASSVTVTVMPAGARRSSRASRAGRRRVTALEGVRGVRANQLRIQERVVIGGFLVASDDRWYATNE